MGTRVRLRCWGRTSALGIGRTTKRIGVSFEAPNHYLKLTALENLRLFAGLHGGTAERPEDLLRRVGLLEDRDKLVAEFSKGMRGRLTLATVYGRLPHERGGDCRHGDRIPAAR